MRTAARRWETSGCGHRDGSVPIGAGSALPRSELPGPVHGGMGTGWERVPSTHGSSPVPFCPLLPPRAGSGEAQTLPTSCSPPGEVEELLPPPVGRPVPPPRGEIPAGRGDPGDSPGCTGSRGAHRGLPVRVGEDPVDLHVAPVGRCHVDPEPPQARVPRAVGAGHVVAVVVLLQQGGTGGQGILIFLQFLCSQLKSGRAAALLSLPVGPGSRGSFPSSSLTAKPTF